MGHWTDNIDYLATVEVADLLGIEPGREVKKRALIEDVMEELIRCIREPGLVESDVYEPAVEYYLACHEALAAADRGVSIK